MLIIDKITVLKAKREVRVFLKKQGQQISNEYCVIHKFGRDILSEVSLSVPKSEMRSLLFGVIKRSDYFALRLSPLGAAKAIIPSYSDRVALEMELKQYIGKKIKEVAEL